MPKFSWYRLLSRRQALIAGVGVTTLVTLLLAKTKSWSYLLQSLDNNQGNFKFSRNKQSFSTKGKAVLKHRAKAKGLIYGAFPQADHQEFAQDTKFQASFIQDCGLLVAGFYWSFTRPSETTFDFTGTDYFAKFASANKMLLRGHPLLWHKALPKWLEETLNQENARNILINHIQTIVQRYVGRIHSWDVVNEGIYVQHGRSDNLRITPWLEFLGSNYIDTAFHLAAAADSKALLVYNEYGLDYDTHKADAKRDAVLELLQRLRSNRVPIHALGIQAHLAANQDKFSPEKLQQFLRDVASLGLKILITEMDVADKKLPIDIKIRDLMVAGVYEDYLSVTLAEPAVIAVLTWGLSDRYTWLSEFQPRNDGASVRSLPLDEQMQRKLAWNAIARSFQKAPKR